MLFDGQELRNVLAGSSNEIELRNEHGRCCRLLSRDEALALDLDQFIGIGNIRRIRFMRPRASTATLNAGSRTTQRLRDNGGKQIAHPLIREHRLVRGNER
jgi:hypothetical protein